MTTTIQIEDETWKMLNDRKQRGETFDSVIRKALFEVPISQAPSRQKAGDKK